MPERPQNRQGGGPAPVAVALDGGLAADLVGRVARCHDKAAFALLASHYAPRVKAFALRAGADGPRAEALVHEVMLALWHGAARFDRNRISASGWIFALVRDVARGPSRPMPVPRTAGASAPSPSASAACIRSPAEGGDGCVSSSPDALSPAACFAPL